MIKPARLNEGDTIGIIAPSIALTPEYIEKSVGVLQSKGFRVKFSKNLFSNTHGFAASPKERAEDFNEMMADDTVKMLLFGGGEVCNEILPYVDFELVKKHPKIVCSYSDSTTLLNALYAKSSLVTFYGCSVGAFENLTDYNYDAFVSRLMQPENLSFRKNSPWRTLYGGSCEGILIGGYLLNFALLMGTEYFQFNKTKKYILFLEDHIKFNIPAAVSRYVSHIEQSGFFENVTGLIIGHYAEDEYPQIEQIYHRIGEKYNIPVVKCDDFGHGMNKAILPIGIQATLDADSLTLKFKENLVI